MSEVAHLARYRGIRAPLHGLFDLAHRPDSGRDAVIRAQSRQLDTNSHEHNTSFATDDPMPTFITILLN